MDNIKELREKLEGLYIDLKEELSSIRTNRPTTKLIEDIPVSYNESTLSIKQLGSIGIEVPRDLIVTPWDKESLAIIEKAIESANLGVSVSIQGLVVRVTLPELTSERREELEKIIKRLAEQTRIKMRTIRDDAHKRINQLQDEDEKFRGKDKLQDVVDKFNKGIDTAIETKIKEISL